MALSSPKQLPGTVQLIDPKTGLPTPFFLRYFNDTVVAAIQGLTATAAAQAAADAANTAAAAATTAAADAATAADQVTADSSLANSYATGLTVTATDAGSNATITISGHTRVYGDGATVAVTGGAVTALAYSTPFYVFYDDVPRAGGAVAYQASTSVQGNGTAPGRHFIGAVTTPAAAGGPVPGNPVLPPGTREP